jgi:hypothetical protein
MASVHIFGDILRPLEKKFSKMRDGLLNTGCLTTPLSFPFSFTIQKSVIPYSALRLTLGKLQQRKQRGTLPHAGSKRQINTSLNTRSRNQILSCISFALQSSPYQVQSAFTAE